MQKFVNINQVVRHIIKNGSLNESCGLQFGPFVLEDHDDYLFLMKGIVGGVGVHDCELLEQFRERVRELVAEKLQSTGEQKLINSFNEFLRESGVENPTTENQSLQILQRKDRVRLKDERYNDEDLRQINLTKGDFGRCEGVVANFFENKDLDDGGYDCEERDFVTVRFDEGEIWEIPVAWLEKV